MKRATGKSYCPVNLSLEVYGDPWSMLIVRDIVFWGKHTYGEFLDSEEAMATSVLATRLAALEANGILQREPVPTNRRKVTYSLTEKGLDLIPILLEMAGWSIRHDASAEIPEGLVNMLRTDRDRALADIRKTVKNGGSIFGPGGYARG